MTKPSRTDRLSSGLLVVIVLSVGVMAGAASFNHVHDWTMRNSPANTADWFGWANAVITELIPTAALIIITKRRRSGGSFRYPMFLLIAAVSLSLTAQLAVAQRTVFGWMVSALPALAFFALSKLVFSTAKHAPETAPAPAQPAAVDAARWDELSARLAHLESRPPTTVPAHLPATPARASSPDTATGTTRPTAVTTTPADHILSVRTYPAPSPTPTVAPTATPADTVVPVVPAALPDTEQTAPAMDDLLPGARLYAQAHRQAHGLDITPGQLAVRLRTDTDTATRLLKALTANTPANDWPHNGSTPVGVSA